MRKTGFEPGEEGAPAAGDVGERKFHAGGINLQVEGRRGRVGIADWGLRIRDRRMFHG